jgi:hypothetical protein
MHEPSSLGAAAFQEWKGFETSARMRLMQRKIGDLRSLAGSLLKDPLWEGAPRLEAEQVQQMDKHSLVALLASGQTAVEQARERQQEATWARGSVYRGLWRCWGEGTWLWVECPVPCSSERVALESGLGRRIRDATRGPLAPGPLQGPAPGLPHVCTCSVACQAEAARRVVPAHRPFSLVPAEAAERHARLHGHEAHGQVEGGCSRDDVADAASGVQLVNTTFGKALLAQVAGSLVPVSAGVCDLHRC